MISPPGSIILQSIPGRLLLLAAFMLFPFVVTVLFGCVALRRTTEGRAAVWLGFRRQSRFIMVVTIAIWWSTWDLNKGSGLVQAVKHSWLSAIEQPLAEAVLFWFPPLLSLGMFLAFCHAFDGIMLRLRWTFIDILRQAWWRLMSFVVPLLMVATGFDAIFDRRIAGVVWIGGAGVLGKISLAFLRAAEGMKMHELKSGETRNRAYAMARRMGVTLYRVYVVPAGRGHLTNAFAGAGIIGVTDNLGKYLSDRQVDSALAHELAHVKERHGLKEFLAIVATYSVVAIALFGFPMRTSVIRVLLHLAVIIAPLLIVYFFSRHFEYAADREAVNFTGDAETAITALVNLYRISAAPLRCSRFTELFFTHPALKRRVEAIASAAEMPLERASGVLNTIENGDSHHHSK